MSDYLNQRRQHIENGRPLKPKKKYSIPKVSKKRAAQIAAERERRGGGDTELQAWYKKIQKQLTGVCSRCGAVYDKKNLSYAICSTAHILAKREAMFPSVATHPLNWVELSPFCGCHDWFDKKASWPEILADPKIGELVADRFVAVEPDIAAHERHRIPDELRGLAEWPFEGG